MEHPRITLSEDEVTTLFRDGKVSLEGGVTVRAPDGTMFRRIAPQPPLKTGAEVMREWHEMYDAIRAKLTAADLDWLEDYYLDQYRKY
jgi:hypothetical protein